MREGLCVLLICLAHTHKCTRTCEPGTEGNCDSKERESKRKKEREKEQERERKNKRERKRKECVGERESERVREKK